MQEENREAPRSGSADRGCLKVLGFAALGLVLLCVVVGVGGWTVAVRLDVFGDLDDPVTGVTEVAVLDNSFDPEAIEVPVGTTVTWTWEGDNQHNVVGDGFESPVQRTGEFQHTFTDPGTYDYECTLHAGMRGEVVVADDLP